MPQPGLPGVHRPDGDRGFYWKPTNEAAKDFPDDVRSEVAQSELDTNEGCRDGVPRHARAVHALGSRRTA